jgi:predicted SAM-dependent methyltransferase
VAYYLHIFAYYLENRYREITLNHTTCLANEGDAAGAAHMYEKTFLSGDQNPETLEALIDSQIHCGEFYHAKTNLKMLARLHGHRENIGNVVKQMAQELNDALHSGKYPVDKIVTYFIDSGKLETARDFLIPAINHNPDLQNLREVLIEKEKIKRLPVTILSAADLLENNSTRKVRWGDYWFKKELEEALTAEGAVIATGAPKVCIHLHGIPIQKRDSSTHNVVWIHSHPDLITLDSLAFYDHIFCLSPRFLSKIRTMGRTGKILIGATAKQPPSGTRILSHDIVLVANGKQGKGRKIIRDLMSLGNHWMDRLEVWGEGWNGLLPQKCIRGLYFDNQKLAALYASARVVLNDHHEDMRREGFLNPRILDVMASGGVVVSDALAGAKEIFGNALLTYSTPAELNHILEHLFQDDDYRTQIRKAGRAISESYSFKTVAREIVRYMASINEDQIETRAKNLYMQKVWAPAKGQLDTDHIRQLKEMTAEQCEGATLDVGCANGDSTAIMKKHNPSLDLTGLELTDWGVKTARRRHRSIDFVKGDAKKLPFTDQSFDTVILDHIIEYFSDPVELILEAKRVARKRVVIGLPLIYLGDSDHKIAWRLDDFKNLLFGFFPDFSIRGMREPDGLEVNDLSKWDLVVGIGFLKKNNRKEPPMSRPLKLHLGCGQRRLPGFLNIDIMPSSAVDLHCDSRRLPLLAGTVSRIETYHMIEHLPRHDFIEALFEWNRILEEGGALMIECPDFEATVREYLEGKKYRINNIFGLQRHPGDFHLFGYTFEDLQEILLSLGFRDIQQEQPTDYHAADEPSLRLTAIKVHAVQRPADVRDLSIRIARQKYAEAIESDKNK